MMPSDASPCKAALPAEDQDCHHVGEEADEAGAQAEHKVAHEVQSLQAHVGQQ